MPKPSGPSASPDSPPARRGHGRLTLYLGCGRGCGKTTRLATEAARLRLAGTDVVVGHGALPGCDVEVVPPLRTGAHDLVVEELDVDAVLRRAPRVCIVDDLAHVNAPGGRRMRRHADVEDLLAAGIDVVTAMDVGHVESLAAVVRRATGAEVRETVPDAVLRRADEVVCVDATVEELERRGRCGSASRAALAAQRELALREVAEWIARRRDPAAPAAASAEVADRVLACVASASPRAEVLVRRAAAIAGRLNADWFVAHVAPSTSPQEAASPDDQQRVLARAVALARELGAEVVTLRGGDPVAAVADFARSHGVTHVVVGRSARPAWQRLFAGTFVSRLLSEAHDLDVHVVGADRRGGDAP